MHRTIPSLWTYEIGACFCSSFCRYTFPFCFKSRFFPSCPFLYMYTGRIKKQQVTLYYSILYHACSCWTVVFLHVLDSAPRILKLIINAMSCKMYQAISATCQIYIEQNCKIFSIEDLRCKSQHTKYWNLWSWRALFQKETMLAQQSKMRLLAAVTR